ncbi:DUF3261 domain-containing protein [Hirschia litorea]|uniref:DUF3261 domain-containing protein n=1 Tax=Hirschia litorea TaxID=1199156 RepID=A0ABW2IJ16_9PROT
MRQTILISLLIGMSAIVSACQSTQSLKQETGVHSQVAKANIGKGVELTLPKIPGFPDKLEAVQTLIARHDGRTQALQAVVSAQSDHVNVVMMLANGPRVMEVDWTQIDLIETRSSFAPDALSGLNILADMFLVFWPANAVENALSEGTYISQTDGKRLIYNDTRQLVEIMYYTKDARGRDHYVLTNFDLGYSLTIYSDAMTAS